jgi:uncharacterized protein (DUF58 family)
VDATRPTWGFIVAAIGTLICAWFLDSVPALFLSVFISGFVVFRALAFLRQAGATASTVSLEREIKPAWIRQGGVAAVSSIIHVRVPPGLSARVSDLPPPGAPVVQGTAKSELVEGGEHRIVLRYGVACLSSGNILWKGMDLLVCDQFFSLSIPFRSEQFRSPMLRVDPVGIYQKRDGLGLFGERDLEKVTVLKGSGVRSFRDYSPGDDPRSVDWKLSAKFGKLFVREYAGLSGKHPLLVVDLPDNAVPCPPSLRDTVVGAALSAAREMSTGPHGCSLMVISGANLLAFLPEERSLHRIERAILEFHSPQRAVQCFRSLDPVTAEAFRMRLAASASFHSSLEKRLLLIYSRFIPEIRPLPFDIQCARALCRRGEAALHVLTTGTGDISHLSTLGLHARRLGVDASLGLPEAMASQDLIRRLRGTGYSVVRVV